MPPVLRGEGEGITDEAPDPLSQCVIPVLYMNGLSVLLAHLEEDLLGKDGRLSLPVVSCHYQSFTLDL